MHGAPLPCQLPQAEPKVQPKVEPVHVAVVPAAGLGTRLYPATLAVDKELLPLGLYPALTATLLEATAAGITELVVVLSPGKDRIRSFLSAPAWERVADAPALAPLRALLSALAVRFVEQPEACGTLDAIERGLGDLPLPCAVLYPDLVHLPDQRGLAALLHAHQQCGEMVFGLYRAHGDQARRSLHGPSARVVLEVSQVADALASDAAPARILRVEAAAGPPHPGEVRTTFGYVHTQATTAALLRAARPGPGLPLDDRRYLAALNLLCDAGQLYGTVLPGEVLDLGTAPGYLDAARRFGAGAARLRDLP